MEIKLEHVLLLLFMIILFYFANNVEGIYDPDCRNIEYSFICKLNPNCYFHWPAPNDDTWDNIWKSGECRSKDPPP